jgi:cyclohexanone monooxygenase
VYNRDNVLLVDVREAPIERITPTGIKTGDAEYALDVIVFATGYDAVTGSLTKIDIRGIGGQTLQEKFAEGPRTYMGLQSAGFPNLFTMPGAGAGNFTRGCEPLVEWVSACIGYMRAQGLTRIEATPQAEEAWRAHVAEAGATLLRTKANSWFVGANIPGKARFLLGSPDSAPVMRAKRAEVAAQGYAGFVLQ